MKSDDTQGKSEDLQEGDDTSKSLFWDMKEPTRDSESFFGFSRWLFSRKKVDDAQVQDKLSDLLSQLSSDNVITHSTGNNRNRNWLIFSIAASVFCLIGISYILYTNNSPKFVVVQTDKNQEKIILLPDSSTVILNGESKLRYAKKWKAKQKRELWLDGEAYFDIQHFGSDLPIANCLIHTDEVLVEVIGTQLNVSTRDEETQVDLEKGKVRLQSKRTEIEQIDLNPGDRVSYSPKTNAWLLENINVKEVADWKDSLFQFVHAPLTEVGKEIENVFGVKVILLGKELKDRRLNVHFPTSHLDVLLKGIESALSAKVTYNQDKNIIVIQTPSEQKEEGL